MFVNWPITVVMAHTPNYIVSPAHSIYRNTCICFDIRCRRSSLTTNLLSFIFVSNHVHDQPIFQIVFNLRTENVYGLAEWSQTMTNVDCKHFFFNYCYKIKNFIFWFESHKKCWLTLICSLPLFVLDNLFYWCDLWRWSEERMKCSLELGLRNEY